MEKITPAIAAYMDRIGAEQLNFRRYMVKEYKGDYYTEKCVIRLLEDGTVVCSKEDYLPTEDEQKEIKAEILKANWPVATFVNNTDTLPRRAGATYYEFWDRKADAISFVQERREQPKAYIPWTFFSDGQWRSMEPDRGLPFFKPRVARSPYIMVHEGSKPAAFVEKLILEGGNGHPWYNELKKYEHWGLIGGALASHRSMYDELRDVKALEVVYVCDNDFPGRSALQEVSRWYGMALKGIRFDSHFPESWDLADKMPLCFFVNDRYIGKPLRSFMRPATRATEKVGKVVTLKSAFREEWVHSIKPEVFIHKEWPDRIYNLGEFNSVVGPYSDADDTGRLLKKDDSSKNAELSYNPSLPPGMYVGENGQQYINTHVPSLIDEEKGDVGLWVEFMNRLIEDEKEREEVMRWAATLIARPEIKMMYGLLMISETQGVGKGTLGEKILAPLMGFGNVSYPAENEIVDSNYNYWLAHRRLAVVHEIYAGHSTRGYNRLKSVITDKYITVSKKYMASYEVENWIHVFACSNSLRALHLSLDDRRWLVPKVTEEKGDLGYWTRLNDWLRDENGLGKIKWWAGEWLKKNEPVRSGAPAPWTAQKDEIIEEGYSPGQLFVSNLLKQIRNEMNGERVLIADTDLVNAIKNYLYEGRHNDRLEKPSTLRKVAKKQGWHINPKRAFVPSWGMAAVGPRLICSDFSDTKLAPSALVKDGRTLLKVGDFVSKINTM